MTPPHRTYTRAQAAADQLASALDDLLGPELPVRPACAGAAPAWDLFVVGETERQRTTRHQRAASACISCPALDACAVLVSGLPARPTGIWAGRIFGLGTPRKQEP